MTDEHKSETEPWWNDGSKVGGLAATVVVIILLGLLLAVSARVFVWIWP